MGRAARVAGHRVVTPDQFASALSESLAGSPLQPSCTAHYATGGPQHVPIDGDATRACMHTSPHTHCSSIAIMRFRVHSTHRLIADSAVFAKERAMGPLPHPPTHPPTPPPYDGSAPSCAELLPLPAPLRSAADFRDTMDAYGSNLRGVLAQLRTTLAMPVHEAIKFTKALPGAHGNLHGRAGAGEGEGSGPPCMCASTWLWMQRPPACWQRFGWLPALALGRLPPYGICPLPLHCLLRLPRRAPAGPTDLPPMPLAPVLAMPRGKNVLVGLDKAAGEVKAAVATGTSCWHIMYMSG